jgi:hypothetical protein
VGNIKKSAVEILKIKKTVTEVNLFHRFIRRLDAAVKNK